MNEGEREREGEKAGRTERKKKENCLPKIQELVLIYYITNHLEQVMALNNCD